MDAIVPAGPLGDRWPFWVEPGEDPAKAIVQPVVGWCMNSRVEVQPLKTEHWFVIPAEQSIPTGLNWLNRDDWLWPF